MTDKPPFWTARYRQEPGPPWGLTCLLIIVCASGIGRGADLALDPDTSSEVFAYANLLGTTQWGTVQALVSAAPLIALASRRQAGVIVSCVAAGVVWAMYAVVIFQGLLPLITTQGGLRNALIPLTTAAFFLLAFMVATHQYRRSMVEEAVRQ